MVLDDNVLRRACRLKLKDSSLRLTDYNVDASEVCAELYFIMQS